MKLVRAKEGYRKVGDKYLLAKKCTACGEWLVASTNKFNRNKAGKYGLHSKCKKCRSKERKQYRENNKKKIAEYGKQYREANKEKIAEWQKQYRKDNKEKIAEQQKQWYETNKKRILEHVKQYREDNKEKIREQKKRYYEANREKILEYGKQYREANSEHVKQYREKNKEKRHEYYKQYCQTPQGQTSYFNRQQRRRIKEQELGNGITKDQWLEMMSFFDWKCAYSGEALTKDTRSIDHIVPLNSNGDNMIWNLVPMTRSLNSSKKDKDMIEWYKEQDFYNPKRLAKIYEWKEYAYNKWGKDTQYFNSGNIQIKLI